MGVTKETHTSRCIRFNELLRSNEKGCRPPPLPLLDSWPHAGREICTKSSASISTSSSSSDIGSGSSVANTTFTTGVALGGKCTLNVGGFGRYIIGWKHAPITFLLKRCRKKLIRFLVCLIDFLMDYPGLIEGIPDVIETSGVVNIRRYRSVRRISDV